MIEQQSNWAGNHTYGAARVHRPETLAEVQALVAGSRKVKALGSRHAFNEIADTSGDLISLERMNRVVEIDPERRMVTVEGGIRYGPLCAELHKAGFALHNMASLPHISVAGATATATHGSGDNNRCLSTAITALEIVTADGDVVTLSRDQHGDEFRGAVVGLGGLGVVTHITLDIEPAFALRQAVYLGLPLEQLDTHFDEIMASGYSVSIFTNWRTERTNQVWVKRRVSDGEEVEFTPDLFGAKLATDKRHMIETMSPENCTEQLGIPGPWNERLPHFRMDFTPSSGVELQSEYFVARQYARDAIRAVIGLREQLAPHLQTSEIRTIAADDLWMSPYYEQDSVALHFTWVLDWPAVSKLLPLIEEQLAPYGARPHWGKLFTMQPDHLRSLYPKLPDFQALLRRYDPSGKFRNAFLDTYILGEQ